MDLRRALSPLHDQRQSETAGLILLGDEAEDYLNALRSLNRIAALGSPEGEDIATAVVAASKRIVPCDIGDHLSPQSTPVCPRCNFILGAPSPEPELKAALKGLKRAVRNRVASLSKILIERLIREDVANRRIETVVRIMQLAQSDGLVRVWDERIARYLSRLLDGGNRTGAKARTETKPAVLVKSG